MGISSEALVIVDQIKSGMQKENVNARQAIIIGIAESLTSVLDSVNRHFETLEKASENYITRFKTSLTNSYSIDVKRNISVNAQNELKEQENNDKSSMVDNKNDPEVDSVDGQKIFTNQISSMLPETKQLKSDEISSVVQSNKELQRDTGSSSNALDKQFIPMKNESKELQPHETRAKDQSSIHIDTNSTIVSRRIQPELNEKENNKQSNTESIVKKKEDIDSHEDNKPNAFCCTYCKFSTMHEMVFDKHKTNKFHLQKVESETRKRCESPTANNLSLDNNNKRLKIDQTYLISPILSNGGNSVSYVLSNAEKEVQKALGPQNHESDAGKSNVTTAEITNSGEKAVIDIKKEANTNPRSDMTNKKSPNDDECTSTKQLQIQKGNEYSAAEELKTKIGNNAMRLIESAVRTNKSHHTEMKNQEIETRKNLITSLTNIPSASHPTISNLPAFNISDQTQNVIKCNVKVVNNPTSFNQTVTNAQMYIDKSNNNEIQAKDSTHSTKVANSFQTSLASSLVGSNQVLSEQQNHTHNKDTQVTIKTEPGTEKLSNETNQTDKASDSVIKTYECSICNFRTVNEFVFNGHKNSRVHLFNLENEGRIKNASDVGKSPTLLANKICKREPIINSEPIRESLEVGSSNTTSSSQSPQSSNILPNSCATRTESPFTNTPKVVPIQPNNIKIENSQQEETTDEEKDKPDSFICKLCNFSTSHEMVFYKHKSNKFHIQKVESERKNSGATLGA